MTLFEQEQAYFDAHKADLLQHHNGKYALIKDDQLAGVYDTEQAAYEAGVHRFGLASFFIKLVVDDQENQVSYFPALQLGLINARL